MTGLLALERTGSGTPVALLHGVTQTRRLWNSLDQRLARDHEVVAVDLPGHGDAAPVGAPVEETADALADAVGPAWWVGYSMGGRHALHVALRHPGSVHGLVLIGASPGLADADERAARVAADATTATSIIVDGVDAFLEEWLAQPLFADLDDEVSGLQERRRNSIEGLASSFVLAGTGAMTPVWERLGDIRCPVTLVVGERDQKFRSLAERMQAGLGGPTELRVVPGAGHAVHLEAPGAVAAIVADAIARG